MQIDIITLFPGMFKGPFSESIVAKAIEKEIVEINIHDLRKWGEGSYKKVDDTPYGGGGGMILMVEPIHNCLKELRKEDSYVIALSAKGPTLKQSKVKQLSVMEHLILIAGHYEGFDQRVLDYLVDDVISIGNYVLTGGEIPSMILVDSIVRLLPGAVHNDNTPKTDSFYEDDRTIQYPQYTRPAIFTPKEGIPFKVPDILLSGNHKEIEKWRKTSSRISPD